MNTRTDYYDEIAWPWARRVLAVSAWTIALVVVIGGFASLGAVARRIESAPAGSVLRVGEGVILTVTGLAVVLAWISSVTHALLNRRFVGAKRLVVAVVLILSNFVGAFFYYFLYVIWTPRTVSPTGKSADAKGDRD